MRPLSNPDTADERQLIHRAQQGEPGVFDKLVSRYQGRIYRAVSRIIPDPAAAEDVVQESFLKAYRAIGKFRGDSAFYSWLYRIALNTAKNDRMKVGRRPTAVDLEDTQMEQLDATGELLEQANPESLYRSTELGDRIVKKVGDLLPEYREALLLREINGLTYEEIAQLLNVPIGTVRSRIYRARMAIEEVKESA